MDDPIDRAFLQAAPVNPQQATIRPPRRARNARNFFFRDVRRSMLGANYPGFANLARIVSHRWAHLSQEEMEYYENLAQEDSVRYQQEMQEYNQLRQALLEQQQQQQRASSDDAQDEQKEESKEPRSEES